MNLLSQIDSAAGVVTIVSLWGGYRIYCFIKLFKKNISRKHSSCTITNSDTGE
jgi:hypothetical protein